MNDIFIVLYQKMPTLKKAFALWTVALVLIALLVVSGCQGMDSNSIALNPEQILAQTHTAEAVIATVDAMATVARFADQTSTATLWTPTPTPTITLTFTPTLVPVTHNADWTPQSTTIGAIKMMRVPPGCFMMGSEMGDSDEKPVHEQCFDAPFWIGQTEVTNAQYAEFVRAGGYNKRDYWTDEGWAWKARNTAPVDYDNFTDNNQPRVGVSWYEAVAYTQWLTEQLRASGAIGQYEIIRLPTESEWEYVAHGPDGLTYPWGDDFDGTRLNFCDSNCTRRWRDASVDDGYGHVTAPVGIYPQGASWVGALDMAGNIWEWNLSGYADYPYVSTDGRNNISSDISRRVSRGGSWFNSHNFARAAHRHDYDPSYRDDNGGFRLYYARG